MKIKKGRTLDQFVEFLYSEYKASHQVLINAHKAECFDLTVNYMQFINQPLKKEMFVNEKIKPKSEPPFEIGQDHHNFIKWNEAEKKIIFKGFTKSQYYAFNYVNNKYSINFENADFIKLEFQFNPSYIVIKTLSDLFQATNGELELQNVEI